MTRSQNNISFETNFEDQRWSIVYGAILDVMQHDRVADEILYDLQKDTLVLSTKNEKMDIVKWGKIWANLKFVIDKEYDTLPDDVYEGLEDVKEKIEEHMFTLLLKMD